VKFSLSDGQQPIHGHRNALVQSQFLLEVFETETERRLGLGPHVVLEVVDVFADGLHRFRGCVSEIREQVQIVEVVKRSRQVGVDERHHTAQRIETHFHENRRRLLDVVASCLDQPRHLSQLRQNAPRAILFRGVIEDGLSGKARGHRVGVDLRTALPRPRAFEIKLP
jgi:hypothetical protein